MSETIIGKFLACDEEDLEETTKYLRQLGMTFDRDIDNSLFYIELREPPEILFKLEQNGYFNEQQGTQEWDILKISEKGVVFYIASSIGDGYVFVPQNNIISIHTISPKYLNELKELNV